MQNQKYMQLVTQYIYIYNIMLWYTKYTKHMSYSIYLLRLYSKIRQYNNNLKIRL